MSLDPHPRAEIVPFRVSFVCAGNICRSPMAEAVFRSLAVHAGLDAYVRVDSAGTGDWHVGERADARAIAALERRGYAGYEHRARQFDPDWFACLDLVVALERSHARALRASAFTVTDREKVHLLRSFDHPGARLSESDRDVPDPYYGDDTMFDRVLGMIEGATTHLFRQLQPAIAQGATR